METLNASIGSQIGILFDRSKHDHSCFTLPAWKVVLNGYRNKFTSLNVKDTSSAIVTHNFMYEFVHVFSHEKKKDKKLNLWNNTKELITYFSFQNILMEWKFYMFNFFSLKKSPPPPKLNWCFCHLFKTKK